MHMTKRNVLIVLGLLGIVAFFFWPEKPYTCESLAALGAHIDGERCIVAGDLRLAGAIDGMPPNLVVQGDLFISGTRIDTLPTGLVVEGNLELYKTSIGALPEGLEVAGNFDNYLGFGSPDIRCAEIPPSVIIRGQRTGCSE